MSANDRQVDGKHYQLEIQPWDYITLNRLGYLEGNIIKYVTIYIYLFQYYILLWNTWLIFLNKLTNCIFLHTIQLLYDIILCYINL